VMLVDNVGCTPVLLSSAPLLGTDNGTAGFGIVA